MKAITTRYIGPTDTRGARIVASDGDGNRATVPYDHSASNPHSLALYALTEKMGWEGEYVEGYTKTGRVYVDMDGTHYHAVAPGSRITRLAI